MIKLAPGLSLPTSATTETFAILARKDGGKTYAGLKSFEEMHAAGAQCVAIDPVGKWWSLRLAADGKSPGIDVPIFGGLHADLPLEPTAGALIARVIVERGISAVVDVSLFEDRDMKRFVTDFARELYKLKQREQSVLHLFIEEASTFCPQDKEDGNDPPMLNAMKKLVRKGRNYGIGVTMIDQRAQDVNKKVLNQTSILVVLGTSGTSDRKAIENWVRDKHIDASGLDELASLEQGDAFVWLPREKTFKRVHIGKRWTFDSSATPKLGAKRRERKLTPTDVSALRDAMKESVVKAEMDDPRVLRKRVVELEKLLATSVMRPADQKRIAELEAELVKTKKSRVERVEVAVIKDSQLKQLNAMLVKVDAIVTKLHGACAAAAQTRGVAALPPPLVPWSSPPQRASPPPRKLSSQPARPQRETVTTNGKISKCALALLCALRQRDHLTRPQLATLAVYSVSSSTFSNGVSEAFTNGWLAKEGSHVAITHAGLSILDEVLGGLPPVVPNTPEALRGLWRGKLGKAARTLFDVLHGHGSLPREELAESSRYSITSSTFSNAISELNTNGLILKDGNIVSLVGELIG